MHKKGGVCSRGDECECGVTEEERSVYAHLEEYVMCVRKDVSVDGRGVLHRRL